jgi:hypothetical protein
MSPTPLLVVLSAAKDLTERSDTGRVAGVMSFAEAWRLLRATQDEPDHDTAHRSRIKKVDAFGFGLAIQAG